MFIHIIQKNFNPRSREGSDTVITWVTGRGYISIHAPAKGATFISSLPPFHPNISIHAPAKGATISKFTRQVIHIDFNPRSREGSDNLSLLTDLVQQYFNPRSREGSDLILWILLLFLWDFNPRSREGSDELSFIKSNIILPFQSTLPRRERLVVSGFIHYCWRFQSTLPRRERHMYSVRKIRRLKFQSTLPRRERRFGGSCFFECYCISIHAPAKGATSFT